MSETKHYRGRLRAIGQAEGETVEDQARKILAKEYNQTELLKYCDSFTQQLRYEGDSKYLITEYTIFEIKDLEDVDIEEEFIKLNENQDGTISFDTQFYNGGASLNEMLEEGFEKLKTNDERTTNS